MRRISLFAAMLLLVLLAAPAGARDPNSGLFAVAVSPDGSTVAMGGDNRVIYIVDAATLAVKNRIWTKARVGGLCYTTDGSHLILEDDDEALHWYDTKTWKPGTQVQKIGHVDFMPDADLCVGVQSGYRKSTVHVLSMTDGSEKRQVAVDASVAGVCLSVDGTRLAVLTGYAKDATEPNLPYNTIPKDLKGITRDVFAQKNDGKTSRILLYDVVSGKLLKERKIWYTAGNIQSTRLIMVGDTVHVHHYSVVCAIIPWEGEIEAYRAKTRFHYGWGVSNDRKAFLCGSLRDATYVTLPERKEVQFQIDKLPGFPEYFRGFCFQKDGTAWGVTSAFRLVKISKEGRVLKTVPVY